MGTEMRLVRTTPEKCPARCSYCFALQPGYKRPAILNDVNSVPIIAESDVFFPACDTDIFADPVFGIEVLQKVAENAMFVTFSTKFDIPEVKIAHLSMIDHELKLKGGRLSVCVSIPTISYIDKLESGTASVEVRISLLEKLKAKSIHTFVAIRPVFANIPESEFEKIFEIASPHCCDFTDGPLYVKKRGRLWDGNYTVQKRMVAWLENDESEWMVLDAEPQRKFIRQTAKRFEVNFWETSVGAVKGYE